MSIHDVGWRHKGIGGGRARARALARARSRFRSRAAAHGGSILRTNNNGLPQHPHILGGRSGLGGGTAAAPMSSGWPVRNAIFSRFAFAAG